VALDESRGDHGFASLPENYRVDRGLVEVDLRQSVVDGAAHSQVEASWPDSSWSLTSAADTVAGFVEGSGGTAQAGRAGRRHSG
jgi:hypothetical protein